MGDNSAGIGSGYGGGCGAISITGGNVTATGGQGGAGIGSGRDLANCDGISITGGTVTATGGYGSAGIGSGNNSNCGNITITNAVTSVTATANIPANDSYARCIGKSSDDRYTSCGTVTVGGTVHPDGIITETHTYTYPPPRNNRHL